MRCFAGIKLKVVITSTVTTSRETKPTIFLFLGNNTNIELIMAIKVPKDIVITVTIDVTVNEISSSIFLYSIPVLGRRCTDRRSANTLTKPMIPMGVS